MRNLMVTLLLTLDVLLGSSTMATAQDDSSGAKNKPSTTEKSKSGEGSKKPSDKTKSEKTKPVDLGTPEGISALKKAVAEKLGLSGGVKEAVDKLFSEHDAKLKQAAEQRQAFVKERGDELKKLQEEAAAAKKADDAAKQKEIGQRVEVLKAERAKIEALADPMPLLQGIMAALEQTQVDRFKSLVKELGVDLDQDPSAGVSGKDFVKAAMSKDVALDGKQKKSVEKLGKAFAEESKKVGSDKAKLEQLTAKLKTDVRAVLNADQNNKLNALLAAMPKKSSNKSKSSGEKSSSEKSTEAKSSKKPEPSKAVEPATSGTPNG